MSDSFISLVPSSIEVPDPEKTAEKIKHWLCDAGIIAAELSDCILSDQLGHAPGINYKDALEDHDTYSQVLDIRPNGLEIISTRNVFHNAGNGLEEVICPSCQFNAHGGNWGDIVDEWSKGGSGLIRCPNCNNESLLSDYDFNAGEPGFIWAFSNLGLTFYNWPPHFKMSFLKQLEKYYSSPVKIVYGKW